MRPAERSRAVDILRALALVLVCFGRHLAPYNGESQSALGWFLYKSTTILAQGGWIGVDLFFVLSGFLVSGLLFREHQFVGRISAGRFLVRRGLKIYPAFWVLILATVTLVGTGVTFKGILGELLFLQNYWHALWGHTWSLAVEEHFYLLLVGLLLFLSRRKTSTNPFRVIPIVFAVLAVASLIGRLLAYQPGAFNVQKQMFPSHLRMDSLFFGVLLSYFYHYHYERFSVWARRFKLPLLGFGMLALAPAFVVVLHATPFIYTYGFTFIYLGSGALLVAALAAKPRDNLIVRAIAYVGSHSYSIYLWHVAVGNWFLSVFFQATGLPWNWFYYLATYVITTFTIGIAMSLLVEFPALRIRDRWYPSLARPLGRASKPAGTSPEPDAGPSLVPSLASSSAN